MDDEQKDMMAPEETSEETMHTDGDMGGDMAAPEMPAEETGEEAA